MHESSQAVRRAGAMNQEENRPTGGGPRRPRLLIADDDAVVRATLNSQLAGDFEICAVAKDTGEAIKLAAENQPDAALIDVEMPGGGGLEAVRQIATRSPATCLVVLSSDESREGVVDLLNAGAIAYLRKGVTATEVVDTLNNALDAQANLPPT